MVVTEEEVFYQAQTCRFFMFCICLNGCEQTKMFSSKSKKKTIFILHSYFSFVIWYEVQQLFSVYDRINNEKQEQTNVIAAFLHLHFKFKVNKTIASSCKLCENSMQYFSIIRCSFCKNLG